MKDVELTNSILSVLRSYGFRVFLSLGKRSVFDIVARKENQIILIKVLGNIDSLKDSQAKALKNLASQLNASALVIGERTKAGEMDDGIVYERYGLPAVTPGTLEDAINGEMPEKKYWKGRLVSRVDPESFSELVRAREVSEIARLLGVRRESVYLYKTGKMNIEYSKARLLQDRFNVKLVGFDILGTPTKESLPLTGYLKDLEKLGFDVVPVHKGFDALAKEREALVLDKEKCPRTDKIEYLKSAGEFLGGHPVLVSETNKECIGGVPVIRESEIKEVKSAKGLIKIVKEREEKE